MFRKPGLKPWNFAIQSNFKTQALSKNIKEFLSSLGIASKQPQKIELIQSTRNLNLPLCDHNQTHPNNNLDKGQY